MKSKLTLRPSVLLPGIASCLLLGTLASQAGDLNWTGASGAGANWNDPLNWTNAAGATVVPAAGDNLIFSGYTQTANNNDLTGLSLGWMLFDSSGFSLTGNPLTVGGGITNSALAGGATVEMGLTLSAAQPFVSESGTLTFNGAITHGTNTLNVDGAGDTAWTMNASQGLKGSGNVIKNGSGNLTWNGSFVNGTVVYGYTGNTIVNGGTLVNKASSWSANSAVGASLTVNPGATLQNDSVHFMSYDGRPLTNYGGIVNLNSGGYVANITLSNAVINGPGGMSCNYYNSRDITVLAAASPSTIGAGITLSTAYGTTGDRTFVVADGAADPDLECTAGINGTGSLTKAGPGKMVLGGAGTYAGNTVISAGTLALSGGGTIDNSPNISLATNTVLDLSAAYFSLNANQTLAGIGKVLGTLYDNNVAPGEVLSPGGAGVAGTLTFEGLNLSGNVALNFELSTNNAVIGGGTNDLLIVTNLTLSSSQTNKVNLNALGGSLRQGVPYTLISYTACTAPAGVVTTLAAPPSHFVYTFNNDTVNSRITVTITGVPYNLVWKGDGTANAWDITTSTNWLVGGVTPDVYYDGDNTTFSDLGSNAPPVNVTTVVKPTTVTVNAPKDYTFSGPGRISGGAKLLKSNTGTLTILTDNDNSGGGSLVGGPVYVGTTPANSLVGGTNGNLGSGPLTNSTQVVLSRSSASTYAGSMTGSGRLLKLGAGQLNLTGSNTLSGGLTIGNGVVLIGANPTVVGARFNGPITNHNHLYFSVTDPFTLAGNVTGDGNPYQFGVGEVSIRGAGGMTVDGTASLATGPFGNLNIANSIDGKLSVAPGGLVNVGGILLLGNVANFKGDVTQTGGTLSVNNHVRIAHYGNNATTMSTYTMGGGTLNVPNGQIAVGWDGIGFMNMTNGTVNCVRLTVDDNSATAAINGTTNSTFTMTGGQLNLGSGGITSASTTNQFVPTVLLSGGTLAAPVANWSSSLHMWLTNGNPTFDTTSNTITLSGVLKGNGGLTKQGPGVLQLDGVNVYTNVTTIAAGRLQGAGTLSAPLNVQSGAVLSAGGTLARGTLTVSNNVTVSPGASLLLDQASTALSTDFIRVYGNLTLDPAGTPINLNFTGGLPYTGGTNMILTNSGARTGTLTYSNPTRYAVSLDQSNPNYVTTSYTGTNASLVWKGNVDNLWNVNATPNWLNVGVADKYYQSDAVLFDSTGLGKPNVTLAADMTPNSVNVNAAGNYTFSGAGLTGVGALTKNGTGTLTLLNSNTLSGGTFVNAGTLQIGNGGNTGYVQGNIADNSFVVFNRSDTSLYSGVISGPGTLTAAGTGKLILTGNQAHYGGSTVDPGATVQLGLGALVDAGSLGNATVTNNGSVIFYRNSNISVAAPYTGPGSLTFQGTGLSTVGAYTLSATNTFTGPVTLSLARLQGGSGALSFGNPSVINVAQGSQVYAIVPGTTGIYTNALFRTFNIPLTLAGTGWYEGANYGALRLNSGAIWAGPITLAGNTRITAYNDGNNNRITGTISGGAYELEMGTGSSSMLTLSPSAPNSYGSLRLSPGTVIADNANALPSGKPLIMNGATLRLNGVSFATPNYMQLATGTIQNSSSNSPAYFTFTSDRLLAPAFTFGVFGETSTQPLHVTWNGPGVTLTLGSASGTWTGSFTNNGGTVVVGTASTYLGSQAVVGRNIVGNNGATFVTTINNALSGYSGNVVLNNSTWVCNRYVSFANKAGSINLANSTITGTNSTDGAFAAMQLPSTVTVRGTAPSYLIGGGTAMGYDLVTGANGGTTMEVAEVTGNAASDLIVGGGSSTAFIRNAANSSTASMLIKTGPGTLELAGANSYTGSTVISNGVIVLTGAGTLAKSALVTVGSGTTLDATAVGGLALGAQTLGGSGTVNGSVTDATGSSVNPGIGTTPGTLTLNGSLTLGGAGTLGLDLDSTSTTPGTGVNDLLQINGNLSFDDAAPTPVNFNFPKGPNAAGTYTIMTYSGSLSGTAAGLTNTQGYAVTFTVGGNKVQATIAATTPKSLVWIGDAGANAWNTDTTSTNWISGSTLANFVPFDVVTFDASSPNTTVNITTPVQPSSITIDGAVDYTIHKSGTTGTLLGTNTLTKNGSGTALLDIDPNLSTGPINVNGGILKYGGNNNGFAGATLITVAPNAAFDFGTDWDLTRRQPHDFLVQGSGPDGLGAVRAGSSALASYAFINKFTLAGNTVIGVAGTGRWDMGGTWPEYGTNIPTLNGQGNNLTKVDTGSIDIRCVVTNLASLTVSNGLLFYENIDQTNTWTATTTNYVRPGASLGVYGGRFFGMPVVLDAATILNQGGGTPLWVGPVRIDTGSLFNNAAAQNFYGLIDGSGPMWVNGGTAALTLSNANTYSGGTIISNAPVTTSAVDAVAGSAAVIAAHPNAFGAGPVTIDGSAYGSLTTNAAFFTTNVLRAVEFAFAAPGTVPNNIILPSTIITNVSLHGRTSGQVVNLAGVISGGFTGMTNWVDFGDATANGVMRYGNTANTFLGTIAVFRGWLGITADGSLGNPANILRLNSAGGLRIDAPGVNVAHPVYLTSTTYLNLLGDNNGDGVPDTANTATISSVINGAQRIRPVGGGTVILTATNTHSGTETWTPGAATVEFANVASLGTGFISPNWGGTFRYTGTGSQSTPCTLWIDNAGPPGGGTIEIQSSTGVLTLPNGGATINQPFYKTGPGTLILTAQGLSGGGLTVNGGTMTVGGGIGGVTPVTLNSGTLTLSGVISATAPVTVNNGTMTLAGASTYVFPTYVNGGTLVVSGSTGGGSLVTVANTATLAGNGTINGPVSLQSGGVLAPGANAIGKLTINNVLSLAGSTVMEISKAANTNDAIVGLTTVNYGGALVINQLDATPFVGGESYKLFAAVVYGGSFSSITLPSLPAGLSWDTTQLGVNGTIRVSATPVAPTLSGIVSAGGGSFTLSFSGPSGQSYKVLATNFVTAPVATWPVLTTGTFGATPATFTDLSATNDTDRFYLITSP